MMLTEDEAKTKWCPFAREYAHTSAQDGRGRMWEGGYSYNRSPYQTDAGTTAGTKCLASACMAWRWGSSEWRAPDKPLKAIPVARGRVQVVQNDPVEIHVGYCGLAGSPAAPSTKGP